MIELFLVNQPNRNYKLLLQLDPSDQANGSTTIVDKSGRSIPVTNTGVVVSDDAPIANKRSMSFAGDSWRYLTISKTLGNMLAGSWSMSYWVKVNATALYDIFAQWKQVAGGAGILFVVQTPNMAINYGPYSDTNALLTTGGLVNGTWTHVAYTRNGSTWICFVNGQELFRTTFATTRDALDLDYFIGGYQRSNGVIGTAGHSPMNGKIANFKIYDGPRYTRNFDHLTDW